MKLGQLTLSGCVLSAALWLSACQLVTSIEPPPVEKRQTEQLIPCPSPRPQMCTQQYDPVCAITSAGLRKTQGNACSACNNSAVVAYVPDECTSAN